MPATTVTGHRHDSADVLVCSSPQSVTIVIYVMGVRKGQQNKLCRKTASKRKHVAFVKVRAKIYGVDISTGLLKNVFAAVNGTLK